MTVKLLTEPHLEFLSLKEGYTGSSESTLVKMPHCWKSHVTAHIVISRNAENTVLSAGKKPCLSLRPIQDMRQGQNLGFSATPQLTVTINPAYPGPRQTHPTVFTSPGNATSRGMPISHGSSSTSQVSATSNSTAAGGLGYQIITTQSPAINRITNPPQVQ